MSAIIITGMHRSGSSMVAQSLQRMGLYLGADDELKAAAADNPEGFFEHDELVEISDRLLDLAGGAWDVAPVPAVSGLGDARFAGSAELIERATLALGDLAGPNDSWGWKDPRISLLWPVWRELVNRATPDAALRTVVTVRNPLEVATSLHKRNGVSYRAGLALWSQYYRSVLDTVPESDRLLTHYEAYFTNDDELARVGAFCGLDSLETASTKATLRHNRADVSLAEARVDPATIYLYEQLCAEAHFEPQAPQSTSGRADRQALQASELRQQVLDRNERVAFLEWEKSELQRRVDELENRVADLAVDQRSATAPVNQGGPARFQRALVVAPRAPEYDRDSGSQDIDLLIDSLLEAKYEVTFIGDQPADKLRYESRLRAKGVATHTGLDGREAMLAEQQFDVAVLAFWEPASRFIPVLRSVSPSTRILVSSMDLHFVRGIRQAELAGSLLDHAFGRDIAAELNTYRAADGVITVSERERDMLSRLLDSDRIYAVPLAEDVPGSDIAVGDRSGMFFVGNFRHLPNAEAVEYLCESVLPEVDPQVRAAHPLAVAGNRLEENESLNDLLDQTDHATALGWVPSIEEHLHSARVVVVPLLHGAGVKRKVLQAMLAGTPVVTTSVGAEGLDLVNGKHAVVADDEAGLAAGLERLLTDDDFWRRLATQGREHVRVRHHPDVIKPRIIDVVNRTSASPPNKVRVPETEPVDAAAHTLLGGGAVAAALGRANTDAQVLSQTTVVHVFGTESDCQECTVDELAIRLVEAGVDFGEVWLFDDVDDVIPLSLGPLAPEPWVVVVATSELGSAVGERLHAAGSLVYIDADVAVWAPGPSGPSAHAPVADVVVRSATEQPVPDHLLAALATSQSYRVVVDEADRPGKTIDISVVVDPNAIVPVGFLDRYLPLHEALGASTSQPTHASDLTWAPPITRSHTGTVARVLLASTPMPLTVSTGADPDGEVLLIDAVPIWLQEPLDPTVTADNDPLDYSDVVAAVVDIEGALSRHDRVVMATPPRLSVAISTYGRPELLAEALEGFCHQTVDPNSFDVVVIDDGTDGPAAAGNQAILAKYADRLSLTAVRIAHAGRSAAKNHAVMLAQGDIVLLFDDDDRPAPDLIAEHLEAHIAQGEESVAVLGYTGWADELDVSPLMRFVTDVDRLLFAYSALEDGDVLDWKGFWEGRISCKRSLLLRYGLHDERLNYSIDVEMSRRLANRGLSVIYRESARSVMARPLDFADFAKRSEAKGRSRAEMVALHPHDQELWDYVGADRSIARWEATKHLLPAALVEVDEIGAKADAGVADETELFFAYRTVFRMLGDKGFVERLDELANTPTSELSLTGRTELAATPIARSATALVPSQPELSVVIPVWSRTPELADMAQKAIRQCRKNAQVATEIIVIENDSPVRREYPARVIVNPTNVGVSKAWNQGIAAATAPVIVVMNSDCFVEPGWDVELLAAVRDPDTGEFFRRIAFPYTDHGDSEGFVQPDQGGTAGWCFALSRQLFDQLGPFDESFSPAFGEDTDYWHRAWEAGVELSPVPAARVTHHRRQTTGLDAHTDWLLQGHRYKYGWKHGVDPHRAPPYYNREIVEFVRNPPAPDSGEVAE